MLDNVEIDYLIMNVVLYIWVWNVMTLDVVNFMLQVVVIEVEDAGPGIPEESVERIFERFYTERPGEESFGKNSGLGLSISRQIVTAHGGRIWAENRKDLEGVTIGARFLVSLPAATQA